MQLIAIASKFTGSDTVPRSAMSHLEVASKSLKAVQQLAMLEGLPEGAAPASALDTGETSSETIEEIQQGIRNLLPDALRVS